MYTHDIRTIWKLIVIIVPIVISRTFLVTPHSLRVLITIEWRIAVTTHVVGTKTQQLIGRQEYGNNKMVGTKTSQSNGRQKNTAAFG